MVRKYSPDIRTEYVVSSMFSDSEYHTPVMVESPHGQYVKLETYMDETKRLRAMIERLHTREWSQTHVYDHMG